MEIDEKNIPCWFFCPIEDCTIKHGKKFLLHHLKFEQARSERCLRCKLNNCGRLYSSIISFEKHLSRWHVSLLDLNATSINDSTVENQVSDAKDVQGSFELIECSDQTSQKQDFFVKNFVHFCTKLKEKYVLPFAAYKNIMYDFITLFAAFYGDVIQRVPASFNENNDEWYLTDKNFLPDLWNKLQNQTLFLNYCKSLGLVQPTIISLSDGSTFQYVSLLDTLVHYLQQPEVVTYGAMQKQCIAMQYRL